jgi:hypothetical protein
MSLTRRAVLEQLAAMSDAEGGETTTVDSLTSALEADKPTVRAEIDNLEACELAQTTSDGAVRWKSPVRTA